MSRVVVDAAVAVKWVVSEAGSAQAAALQRHTLMAPETIVADWTEILSAKTARAEITPAEARARLEALLGAPIALAPLRPLVGRALEIAGETGIATRVAIHVALAVAEGGIFVTTDNGLADRLESTPWRGRVAQLGAPLAVSEPPSAAVARAV